MTAIEDVICRLQNLAGGDKGSLTPEEASLFLDLIEDLEARIGRYDDVIRVQQKQFATAIRIYKRYSDWPTEVTPDLTRVIAWLIDTHSGRKQALKLKEALEEAYARMDKLGYLDFDSEYNIKGRFLIGLRVILKNALQSRSTEVPPASSQSGSDDRGR